MKKVSRNGSLFCYFWKMDAFPKIYLYRRIVQAKLFIDTAYAENIDLDEISNAACFSKYHFIRIFKKAYGKTPHQYLTWVRINKAQQLLEGNMAVGEVCHSLGFDSLSSFSLLFKKANKMTPAQYRLEQSKRKKALGEKPLAFVPNCFAEQKGWQ